MINQTIIDKSEINHVDLGLISKAEVLCCGDTHFGSAWHDKKMSDFVVKWVSQSKDRYVLFAGDLLDAATKNSISDSYPNMDPLDAQEMAENWVNHVNTGIGDGRNHMLGAVMGNHDRRYVREIGVNPVGDIFRNAGVMLGTGYEVNKSGHLKKRLRNNGYLMILDIMIGHCTHYSSKTRSPVHYAIVMHHGTGGSGTPGNRINMMMKLPRMVSNADAYVVGHTHMVDETASVLTEINDRYSYVYEHPQEHIMVPGMLKPNGSYADEKMLPHLLRDRFPVMSLSGEKKEIKVFMERIS